MGLSIGGTRHRVEAVERRQKRQGGEGRDTRHLDEEGGGSAPRRVTAGWSPCSIPISSGTVSCATTCGHSIHRTVETQRNQNASSSQREQAVARSPERLAFRPAGCCRKMSPCGAGSDSRALGQGQQWLDLTRMRWPEAGRRRTRKPASCAAAASSRRATSQQHSAICAVGRPPYHHMDICMHAPYRSVYSRSIS